MALQLETNLDTVLKAAMIAKKYGIDVLLRAAPVHAKRVPPPELLRNVDYLVVSNHEARVLVDSR